MLGLAALTWGLLPHEPRHAGKSLSEWLEVLVKGNDAEFIEAAGAVRAMGSGAVPHLRRWLNAGDSWGRTCLISHAEAAREKGWIHFRLLPAESKRARALAGISVLGPVARPLIADLEKSREWKSSQRKITFTALATGPRGARMVSEKFDSLDDREQRDSLMGMVDFHVNVFFHQRLFASEAREMSRICVRVLVKAVKSDNPACRYFAAMNLHTIAVGCPESVPDTVVYLVQADERKRHQAAILIAQAGKVEPVARLDLEEATLRAMNAEYVVQKLVSDRRADNDLFVTAD
ncbi:MAG: hypothetical protein AB1705_04085 [Verrucomicrobiota bacterium]